jgi:hypothetical protein
MRRYLAEQIRSEPIGWHPVGPLRFKLVRPTLLALRLDTANFVYLISIGGEDMRLLIAQGQCGPVVQREPNAKGDRRSFAGLQVDRGRRTALTVLDRLVRARLCCHWRLANKTPGAVGSSTVTLGVSW